jgi:hypothetical protein
MKAEFLASYLAALPPDSEVTVAIYGTLFTVGAVSHEAPVADQRTPRVVLQISGPKRYRMDGES